ncbi:MAG: SDR family oxidoreductase [Deltaproteobacteria bacterium]|nr:SDR family oxidoreductase [Deltaproteobacteria bacterium]
MNVLITGATGFIGTALIKRLDNVECQLHAMVRPGKHLGNLPTTIQQIVVRTLLGNTEFNDALHKIDAIVHLAARAHVMVESSTDPLSEYRAINTAGTEHLARQAAAAGVKRLVFLSSVKVNGEGRSEPFTEEDLPVPSCPYGVSKQEAEQALRRVSAETGLEVVILRPPLVYGAGVKGNFLRLLKAVDRGFPLPFGRIRNKRSFIYLGNLVDIIAICLTHPKAANQIFLVSDGEDISTPELTRRVAVALGRPTRLLTFPALVLRISGWLFGKSAAVKRLVESLRIDSSKIHSELGWHPSYTMEQGLRETAEWFKNNARNQDRGK